MAYDNTNRGALFKNKKPKNENSPGYNGSLNVNGTDYWINAWIREKEGEKYFSLSIKPKEESAPAAPPAPSNESDEVPF